MKIAVVCTGCNEVASKAAGFVGNEECPNCSKPLFATVKNESARLNRYNYNQHPTLSRVLDSVTRTR